MKPIAVQNLHNLLPLAATPGAQKSQRQRKNFLRLIAGLALTMALFFSPQVVYSDNSYPALNDLGDLYDCLQFIENGDPYQGVIKFSATLDSQGQIQNLYFQNNHYKFHRDFLVTLPPFKGMTDAQLDAISLHPTGRRLLLGALLVRRTVLDGTESGSDTRMQVDYDLTGAEPITATEVASVHKVLGPATQSVASQLKYLGTPDQRPYIESHAAEFASLGVPLAQREAANRTACYSPGLAFGRMKRVAETDLRRRWQAGEFQPSDILIMDKVPRELPPFGGLVVGMASSPSSHPALLAQMTASPFLFVPGAFESDRFASLEATGRPVLLSVIASDARQCNWMLQSSEQLTPQDASLLTTLKQPTQIDIPTPHSTLPFTPVDLQNSQFSVQEIGSKAANVAHLMRFIPNNSVDAALAIPLSAYQRFIQGDVGTLLRNQLDSVSAADASSAQILAALSVIGQTFDRAPFPADLREAILKGLSTQWPKGTRLKFRSSSNAEDGEHFNGAGLYESKGACLGDDDLPENAPSLCGGGKRDPVLKALRKVWASLYTPRAYFMRRYFRINESLIAMGILVHPSFGSETANGVAISSAVLESSVPRFAVASTGFPGETDSVTNPPAGKTPESVRLTQGHTEWVTRSTEVQVGSNLLTAKQYTSLFTLVQSVHRQYAQMTGKGVDALRLDLEWKRTADGRMIIKQFRPVPSGAVIPASQARSGLVLGARNLKLCPAVRENADGMSRMLLNHPLKVDIASHLLPLNDDSQMPSPLLALAAETASGWQIGQPSSLAQLSYTQWRDNYSDPSIQDRIASITTSAELASLGTYRLSWQMEQKRRKDGTSESALDPTSVRVGRVDAELLATQLKGSWPLASTLNLNIGCVLDAHQGYLPDFVAYEEATPSGRTPRPVQQLFTSDPAAPTANLFRVVFAGRTSVGGFDKTLFQQMERVTISWPLTAEPVIIPGHAAVYAAAHHNFGFEFVADLWQAQGIDPATLERWKSEGTRYLLVGAPEDHQWEHNDLFLVDLAGRRTRLATLIRNRHH